MTLTVDEICDCFEETKCVTCDRPVSKHCCTTYHRHREIEYIDYQDWISELSLYAPDIDDSVLKNAVRQASINFADRTGVLLRNIELDLQDCVGDFYPCLGDQERINTIRLLTINNTPYTSIDIKDDRKRGNQEFWFYPPCSLEIHPSPKPDDKVEFVVSGVPSQNSTKADKLLWDRYHDAIISGTMASIHMIPNLTSTSGEMSLYQATAFDRAVKKAKIEIAKNFSTTPQYWGNQDKCGYEFEENVRHGC